MNDASHPYCASLPEPAPARSSRTHGLAFAWGLAEATFFFIVPDVLLTRVALRDFHASVIASFWAVGGALVGGTALWFAAQHNATQFLLNAFDWIPGISRELIIRTAQSLDIHGLAALTAGALSGQPYKLFAVHAGAQEIPLLAFLAASAAARFARFTLTSTVVWLAGRVLRRQTAVFRLNLHASAWCAFYAAYFVLAR